MLKDKSFTEERLLKIHTTSVHGQIDVTFNVTGDLIIHKLFFHEGKGPFKYCNNRILIKST